MVTRSTPYIGTHIGVSVRLVICRTTIGMIDSVAIGVWSAVRQYSAADRIVSFLFTGTPKNLTNYGAATFQTTRAEDCGGARHRLPGPPMFFLDDVGADCLAEGGLMLFTVVS